MSADGSSQAWRFAPLSLCRAWTPGDLAGVAVQPGVQTASRREIHAAKSPDQRGADLEAPFDALRSPFRAAEALGAREIIDRVAPCHLPCGGADPAERKALTRLGPSPRTMRP